MEIPEGPRLDVSAPSRFDTAVAHPARVYNVWLGGKDHYAADRHAVHEVMRRSLQVVTGALANRQFLARVVGILAASLASASSWTSAPACPPPTTPTKSPSGSRRMPDRLRRQRPHRAHPRPCPAHQHPRRNLRLHRRRHPRHDHDPGPGGPYPGLHQPAAVLLLAVLHFVPGAGGPAGIVKALAAALAPGSYLAITHLTADFAPATVTAGVEAYNTLVPRSITPRTHAQVTGLVRRAAADPARRRPLTEWHPDHRDPRRPARDLYAGAARPAGAVPPR